ncbi:FadR/GntR family transcriptional regulator [Petroclostridium sp. X23]|uniref:FadR/GntR family transcriptional regulator n=1 Tax=Petroclostridium sp. X23 TaxID=3045146 RepID=UPI0024AE0234|nr:FadR/GntR family transcriptional regulator [Petroclostridium sp. X23]WHH60932.1 FadR/GntR family transcriptional regulator [Petroclostridium sp. X23]
MKKNAQNWLSPVPNKPLSRVVVEKIKEAMIDGALKPGDDLPSENELADRLGVGKSSVREAVKMLEAMGVVEISKGQRSRIRTSVDADILNPLIFQLILQNSDNNKKLLEFRKMFETSASVVAMQNATEEDIVLLKSLNEKMEKDFAAGITSQDNDMAFHRALYRSTHNPFIVHIGNTVINLFRPSLKISNRDYSQVVLEDHKNILNAIIAKDEEALKKAITQSLDRWDLFALNAKE